MANQAGKIAALLVRDGFLTPKQVEYATRIRARLESPRTFLEVLKELKYVTDDQINQVIRTSYESINLENLLLELGLLSEENLKTALQIQAEEKPPKSLREILVQNNFIGEQKLVQVLSQRLGFPLMELDKSQIDRQLFSRGPVEFYAQHHLLPVGTKNGEVWVAFADPLGPQGHEETRRLFGKKVFPVVASLPSIKSILKHFQEKPSPRPAVEVHETSAVSIVDSIIMAAVQEGDVSDIHIEPMLDRLRVRFRQDGILVQFKEYPTSLIPAITARLKVMCNADIAEKRRPQGGRLFYEQNGQKLDIRASFYVTVHGEKIVLRILNRMSSVLNLEEVGMLPRMLKRFREDVLDRPSGVMITTGPTGSGKTTTVYSCINYIKTPYTSIITAEDPVEYIIDGIAQCSINPTINLTYEEALRHIVRQDPDVIVIGEIRDNFSAQIAVQAALTGHKVLTTFHTEDSIGGIVRLLNMDIEAFLISSTVVSVVAQRLVRKVCSKCSGPYRVRAGELLGLGLEAKDIAGVEFRKGQGCPHCRYTGYKGRIAVFELLILDENVRNAILDRKMSHEIRVIAMESNGLTTLLEDGILKAVAGLTTPEELLRCLPRLLKPRPLEKLQRLLGGVP
ncbi:MAG: type II/IV secretion system protein [Syntrophaceae bacterium]|nr:type II/IV secretion system protein [Syntrophaceae bacterium]